MSLHITTGPQHGTVGINHYGAAVVHTFDKVRSRLTRAPRLQQMLATVERVDMVGRDAARFVLTRPTRYFLPALAEVAATASAMANRAP